MPLIVGGLVALALLGGLAFFLTRDSGSGSSPDPAPAPTAPAPTAPAPTAPAPAAPAPTAPASAAPAPTAPVDEEVAAPAEPVESVDELITEQVGDYSVSDRVVSEPVIEAGATDSAELTYSRRPASERTNIYHTIGVFDSPEAAQNRARDLAAALEESGYTTVEDAELTDANGTVQGVYIVIESDGIRNILWSNRNVYFSLGGGEEADVDAFYEQLPY